jgi:putative ABC transport system substrate-binding protein
MTHRQGSFPASRREFITLLGGAATAWPIAARAQQPQVPIVGYLSAGSPEIFASRLRAFHQGLSEVGYIEGRNVAIEYRWAGDQSDQLRAMAADLVRRHVAVIIADGPAVPQARAESSTIPVVFFTAGDPVASGLSASLNRPNRNLTGVTSLGAELGPKRLELLHEMIPSAKSFGFIVNPNRSASISTMEAAGRTLGVGIHVLHATSVDDIDPAFATLVQRRAGGVVINPELIFSRRTVQLAETALRYKLPAIYQFREFVAAGGLMSYGGNVTEPFRTIGFYTGRILKGEKAADLPIQQATRVELIINMKTAMALGLTFPLTLLGRADEVIE